MKHASTLPLLLTAILSQGCAHVPLPQGPLGVMGRAPYAAIARQRPTLPSGPLTPRPGPVPERPRAPRQDAADALARAARALLEEEGPSGFRDDCSGFVCAAASHAGLTLDLDTTGLWQAAEQAGALRPVDRARPGDLVFFDDTWDANRNGRIDDPLSHVGVLVEVLPDGIWVVAHRSSSKGRTLMRVTPDRPHEYADTDGQVLNDYLRRQERRDPRGTRYLAGELLRGIASTSDLVASGETEAPEHE